jgi:hypothetical protein
MYASGERPTHERATAPHMGGSSPTTVGCVSESASFACRSGSEEGRYVEVVYGLDLARRSGLYLLGVVSGWRGLGFGGAVDLAWREVGRVGVG